MQGTNEASKKTGLLAKFYFTANDSEKEHFRKAAIKRFKFSEKHFFKWIKSVDNVEALALWQYCFETEIMANYIVKNYKFFNGGIQKYREPELFI